jgi:hypothetical protein
MQLLRTLPVSLFFVVLSTVVSAVPIQSDSTSPEDDSVVWVTETVWPCAPATSTSLAVATPNSYSVNQKSADYDTVPVDGSDNADTVSQEISSSATESTETIDPPIAATSAELAVVAIETPTSTTETSISTPSTSLEVLVYTAVNEDPPETVTSPISSADRIDSFTFSSDPPSTTASPEVQAVAITPQPTMPLILPTILPYNNGINSTCTATDNADEYTPEEESAYWATATEPSIIYSDYTVMFTMTSTSVITISDSATADPVATTTTTTSVTGTDPPAVATTPAALLYANNMTTATSTDDTPLTYTLDSDATQAVSDDSSDPPSTTMAAATSTETAAVAAATSATALTTSSMDLDTMTTADPSIETVSGTVITYLDVTTTVTSQSSTTTTDTVTTTPTNTSNYRRYDTTTTTTEWVTSTIIVEESATTNARKRRRRILVTRA